METAGMAETLTVVTDTHPLQARIDALVDELERHPDIPIERLARAAGFTYQTWRNLVTGKSRRASTLERFEAALRDLIEHPEDIPEEPTHVMQSTTADLIEFEITGDFGVRAVVRGPVANVEELERAAERILDRIRRGQGSGGE